MTLVKSFIFLFAKKILQGEIARKCPLTMLEQESRLEQEDPFKSHSLVSAIVCWFVLIIILKVVGNE